jgi:hypothetical protein
LLFVSGKKKAKHLASSLQRNQSLQQPRSLNPIPNPRMRRQILISPDFLAGSISASSSTFHRIRLKDGAWS